LGGNSKTNEKTRRGWVEGRKLPSLLEGFEYSGVNDQRGGKRRKGQRAGMEGEIGGTDWPE